MYVLWYRAPLLLSTRIFSGNYPYRRETPLLLGSLAPSCLFLCYFLSTSCLLLVCFLSASCLMERHNNAHLTRRLKLRDRCARIAPELASTCLKAKQAKQAKQAVSTKVGGKLTPNIDPLLDL